MQGLYDAGCGLIFWKEVGGICPRTRFLPSLISPEVEINFQRSFEPERFYTFSSALGLNLSASAQSTNYLICQSKAQISCDKRSRTPK